MIEPTETESLFDLDHLINAFIKVAQECKENPNLVKSAPHTTALSRIDEVKAAKDLILSYIKISLIKCSVTTISTAITTLEKNGLIKRNGTFKYTIFSEISLTEKGANIY